MAFKGYVGPLRTSNEVILYIDRKSPPPEAPPFELQGSINKDVWQTRLATVQRLSQRYSKPILERVWLLLAFFSVFIAPLVIYPILARTVEKDDNAFNDDFGRDRFNQDDADRFFQARAISFGIFFGLGFLFFAPLTIWKLIARRRVNATTRGWLNEDQAAFGPGRSVPAWRITLNSAFSNTTTVRITLPYDTAPTTFHPDAYLPSFINGPQDPQAQQYYAPRLDAVPLYSEKSGAYGEYGYGAQFGSDEKRRSGGYAPPAGPPPGVGRTSPSGSGRTSPTQNPFADRNAMPKSTFEV